MVLEVRDSLEVMRTRVVGSLMEEAGVGVVEKTEVQGHGVEDSLMVETGEEVVAVEEEGLLVKRAWVEGNLTGVGGRFVVVVGEGVSLLVAVEVGEMLGLIGDEGSLVG